MRSMKTLAAAVLLGALVGCAKPIPQERSAYVGEWHGASMDLRIEQDGRVAYRRWRGSVHTSIDAPLREFEGDNFIVGVGPLTTIFVVSAPPHEVDGNWKMTVDGVELTKMSSTDEKSLST